jgi:hypothetical protein
METSNNFHISDGEVSVHASVNSSTFCAWASITFTDKNGSTARINLFDTDFRRAVDKLNVVRAALDKALVSAIQEILPSPTEQNK